MLIGELAGRTGVPAKTIRYWEGEGLVPPPERTASGYRVYEDDAADRLAFIRHSQAAGFTIRQIKSVLDVTDHGDAPCEHVTAMVRHRLAEVEARIIELRKAEHHLTELVQRAESLDPADCAGYCQILKPAP